MRNRNYFDDRGWNPNYDHGRERARAEEGQESRRARPERGAPEFGGGYVCEDCGSDAVAPRRDFMRERDFGDRDDYGYGTDRARPDYGYDDYRRWQGRGRDEHSYGYERGYDDRPSDNRRPYGPEERGRLGSRHGGYGAAWRGREGNDAPDDYPGEERWLRSERHARGPRQSDDDYYRSESRDPDDYDAHEDRWLDSNRRGRW